jgi:hypothetical protein
MSKSDQDIQKAEQVADILITAKEYRRQELQNSD